MNLINQKVFQIILATVVGGGCLFVSEKVSLTDARSLMSSADARIGRPLTPMSYAGVARRTTRRAVVGGAVVYGAPMVVAPPVVVAPARQCVQAVDPYGRIYARCY